MKNSLELLLFVSGIVLLTVFVMGRKGRRAAPTTLAAGAYGANWHTSRSGVRMATSQSGLAAVAAPSATSASAAASGSAPYTRANAAAGKSDSAQQRAN